MRKGPSPGACFLPLHQDTDYRIHCRIQKELLGAVCPLVGRGKGRAVDGEGCWSDFCG